MSAQYDIWVLRDGAVHHRGTTDTTLGVLRPTEIGAIAKGAVVLMYRGGTKAQHAELLKAAQERAVRLRAGLAPETPAAPASKPLAERLGDRNEAPTNGCDEGEDDGETEDTDSLEAPRRRGRPKTVRAAPTAASARSASPRPVYRPPPEAPPSTLFAAAPLPCRDCGETEGHTPRCPRNPDAEILPEPIYAPRPAVVVCERSIERAANVAATWSAAPPAANDTEAPVVPVVTELDLGPLAMSSAPSPATLLAAQPAPSPVASSAVTEAPAQHRPKARAARPKVARRRSAAGPKPLARRSVPPSAQEALVEDFTRRLLALFDRSAQALLRRRPW